MSGEEEHDEPRGSPGQRGKASAAPISRGGYVPGALLIGGVLALGFGLLVGCGVIYPNFFYIIETREDEAHASISIIEKAVADYKTRHGDYPSSLAELTKSEDGKASYLVESDLIDPWGTPYRYDLQDRQPTTGRPKIFTVSPKGDEIRNWWP